MPCRHHSPGYRHPSGCRFCRADHARDPDERKLAPSERAKRGQIGLGLELVTGEPPPKTREVGKWQRVTANAKA